MEGVENVASGRVPEVVSFSMGGIANEDAGDGLLEEFGVIGWGECVGAAANFTEVGEGGGSLVPKFGRHFSSNGGGSGKVGEVGSGSTELILEVGRGITCKAHGTSFIKQSVVEVVSMTILCGCIGCGELMVYAMKGGPGGHGVGGEFAVVSD